MRFACIGVGGKGDSDTNDAGKHGEIVAPLRHRRAKSSTRWAKEVPKAKKYFDYRKMLEELGDKIDAVTVSTPDHTHAPASVMAMRMGKHCFCQKPLTWSVEEARLMRTLAAEKKLCTQMGNQGTAENGFREGVELIRSGILGPIKEIRSGPIARSGRRAWAGPRRRRASPTTSAGTSSSARPTTGPTIPTISRSTGGAGSTSAPAPGRHGLPHDQYRRHGARAVRSRVGRGRRHLGHRRQRELPGLVDHPHQVRPAQRPRPADSDLVRRRRQAPRDKRRYKEHLHGERRPPDSGLLLVGEKGSFFSRNDYGAEHILLPKDKFKEVKKPKPTLPRSPGHFTEWVDAIKASDPTKAMSNFDYAGRLTETVLLGVVALKAGTTIEWDPVAMRAKNVPVRRSVHPARLSQGIFDPR